MEKFKSAVLQFMKTDRTLTGAKNLYNRMPGKSLALQNSFNRLSANNPKDVRTVCYELCRMVGLENSQFESLMSRPVLEPTNVNAIDVNAAVEIHAIDTKVVAVLGLDPKSASYNELKRVAKELQETEKLPAPINQKKDTLIDYVEGAKQKALSEVKKEIPQDVKSSIKLRDQFPFLREKECPGFLKELVNDLITSYDNYIRGRQQLFDSMTLEQEAALAEDITENYIDNKQAFKELAHYRDNGQILGEHPLYRERQIKEELKALSPKALSDKVSALRKNISTNKKKAQKAKSDDAQDKYLEKVEDYTWQLDHVTTLLNSK